jgi:hypothetical protein
MTKSRSRVTPGTNLTPLVPKSRCCDAAKGLHAGWGEKKPCESGLFHERMSSKSL